MKCKYKGCPNDKILFSEFCGNHISEEELAHHLKRLEEGGTLESINLSRLNIKSKKFSNLNINDLSVIETYIVETTFVNCKFAGLSNFSHCTIDDVKFDNIEFINVEFEDVNFSGAKIENCKFIDCTFNQCYFTFESLFYNNHLERLKFIGSYFDDCTFIQNAAENIEFLICTFDKCNFERFLLKHSELNTTNIINNKFYACHFQDINHDFGISSYAYINYFEDTSFKDLDDFKDFEKYNTTSLNEKEFYSAVYNSLTESPNTNQLNLINKTLYRILEIGTSNEIVLRNKFFDVYQELYKTVRTNKDYVGYSKMIESFSFAPEEIKKNDHLLLPTGERKISSLNLKIKFKAKENSLRTLPILLQKLNEVNKLISYEDKKVEVARIERGSFWVELVGQLSPLLILLYLLYKYGLKGVATDVLDIQNKALDVKKKKLEIREKTLKIKEMESKDKLLGKYEELHLKKLENEVKKQQIELIKEIAELNKIDLEKIEDESIRNQIEDAILDLNEDYEILDLNMEIPEKLAVEQKSNAS